jgi:hypothetical protein
MQAAEHQHFTKVEVLVLEVMAEELLLTLQVLAETAQTTQAAAVALVTLADL